MLNTPIKQLFTLVFIIAISFVGVTILSTILGIVFYGFNAATTPSLISNNINYLRLFQLMQSIGLFILPPFIYCWLNKDLCLESLKINTKPKLTLLFISATAIIICQPIISYSGSINHQIHFPQQLDWLENWMITQEHLAQQTTELFLNEISAKAFLINLILIAIIPAFGEELLFRGTLQPIFIRLMKNKHLGIWCTAILFSAIHVQFLGFLPRMLLGALFGYMVIYGRNLWLAISCHFINNSLALILYYKFKIEQTGQNPLDASGNDINPYVVSLSLILTLVCLYFLKKMQQKS